MFMNMFIHVLEATTSVLLLVLACQVFRCYKAFERSATVNVKLPPAPFNPGDNFISKRSDEILTDYIDCFFTDSSSSESQAHKAPVILSLVEKRGTGLDELEEDSIITVMAPAEGQFGFAHERVMTDKVVHAMLDEAKLVCAS